MIHNQIFEAQIMNRENEDQVCAVCKLRRRRCDQYCQFGQYFPIHRFNEFKNACRLFGMKNILEIMNYVGPEERPVTADSILFEGNAWANDRVYGCVGYIIHLTSQIASCEKQLADINKQLWFHREVQQLENPNMHINLQLPISIQTSSGNVDGFQNPSTPEECEDVKFYDLKHFGYPIKLYEHPKASDKGESRSKATDHKGKGMADE